MELVSEVEEKGVKSLGGKKIKVSNMGFYTFDKKFWPQGRNDHGHSMSFPGSHFICSNGSNLI